MKRSANDKLIDVAKEMAEFLGESKYGLSFTKENVYNFPID